MNKILASILSLLVVLATTAGLTLITSTPAHAAAVAFPGAEGFGTNTTHGRGGQVIHVTNLNDSGTGSLRAAVSATGPRIVVFDVGGTINLNSRITVTNPNLYIAGQSAPGDGITLRMSPTSSTDQGTMQIETHDVLVRFIRFRPGNEGGGADDSHDAVQIYKAGVNNVVIDHNSLSWAVDENANTYDESDNITFSNNIISEALDNSTHPDGDHSKGMLSGGVNAHNVSIHHNLFASNVDRNPQISGVSVADVRNNVMYNYGDGSGNGTTLISSSKGNPVVNIINNYYKKGPSSPSNYPDWALYSGDNGCVHQVHVAGNKHNESGTVTNATRGSGCDSVGVAASPFPAPAVTTTTAEQAYVDVLADAGASKVRDAVDVRIVNEVQNRTGSFRDEGGPWPTLASGTKPADSDNDGMSDAFEAFNGGNLTPSGDADADGYTNIEEYLSQLAGDEGGTTPPPVNQAPSVNAGSNATVTLPNSANLDGTVSDDGLPNNNVTSTWSKVSGPGTVAFGSVNSVDTTASFSQAGTYVLRLTANDGALTTSDDVQVVVNPQAPTNSAPSVNAGQDASTTLPDDNVDLNGTVSDDGLPNNNVTTTWSKVSGPGTVAFGNASAVDTSATFSAAGTYVLRLTASDGALSNSDDVTVVVNPADVPPVVQSPNVERMSTACGVVDVEMSVDDEDNAPSDFEVFLDGNAVYAQQLDPGDTPSRFTETLAEDFSGGSANVVVTANGANALSYTVNTDCEQAPPASGVSFVSQGGNYVSGGTVTVSPTGVQPGDKVVFQVVQNKGNGKTITAPSGVTALGAQVNDGSSLGARLYVHNATASSPSTFTFGSGASEMVAKWAVYRGVSAASQVAHVADQNSDAAHPVSGTTTVTGWNVVFAADRVYDVTGDPVSTWTLGAALTERGETGGVKSGGGSTLSQVVGDTNANVGTGGKTYPATASRASTYGITGLVQLNPLP